MGTPAEAATTTATSTTEPTTTTTTTPTTTTATPVVVSRKKYWSNSWNSVYSFCSFFVGMFVALCGLIETAVYYSSSSS